MNSYDKNIYDQPHKEKWQEISSKLQYQSKESLNNQVDNRQSRFTQSHDLDSEGNSRKRNKKFNRKTNINLIEHFISLNSHLKSNTLNKYQCILKDFHKLSPSFNPYDVFEYLKFKYAGSHESKITNQFKYSTLEKCRSLLRRFMNSSYYLPKEFFEHLNSIKDSSNIHITIPKVTINDVVSAYNKLIRLRMYDDALLIQLLYSLALCPEDLSMLRHEGVDKKGFLNYVDFKTGEYHKIYIDDKIVLFMLDYTNYKGPDNPYFNKTTRKR